MASSTHVDNITAVNYHFTRKCNYKCGFCFHTAKTSHVESLDNAKRILEMLVQKKCKKINFAGGEPFLPEYKDKLGEMVKYCKEELKFESVSIISNAYFIKEEWFEKYSKYLDILGVSCDSCNEATNKKIGRGAGNHMAKVKAAADLCHKYGVIFKLNTVVNAYNWEEDMTEFIATLNPKRWKVFQVLPMVGENSGDGALRNVTSFLISSEQFQQYVERHSALASILKEEDNTIMRSSYILVDEYGRFLDCSNVSKGKAPTSSMLDVGIDKAWEQLVNSEYGGYDEKAFVERDGNYATLPWNRKESEQEGGCSSNETTVDIEDLVKE